jgi:hypothetical protein
LFCDDPTADVLGTGHQDDALRFDASQESHGVEIHQRDIDQVQHDLMLTRRREKRLQLNCIALVQIPAQSKNQSVLTQRVVNAVGHAACSPATSIRS